MLAMMLFAALAFWVIYLLNMAEPIAFGAGCVLAIGVNYAMFICIRRRSLKLRGKDGTNSNVLFSLFKNNLE
jgi:hypothetical protein